MTRAAVITPRGLRCEQAAFYVGFGRTKFLQMVDDGRMPRPRRVDGRHVWDVRDLDVAFDALPIDGEEQAGWSHGND